MEINYNDLVKTTVYYNGSRQATKRGVHPCHVQGLPAYFWSEL